MLLLICSTYLVLTFPFKFRELYVYYVDYGNTPDQIAMSSFTLNVTVKLMIMKSGINFFLYLLSGQKFLN